MLACTSLRHWAAIHVPYYGRTGRQGTKPHATAQPAMPHHARTPPHAAPSPGNMAKIVGMPPKIRGCRHCLVARFCCGTQGLRPMQERNAAAQPAMRHHAQTLFHAAPGPADMGKMVHMPPKIRGAKGAPNTAHPCSFPIVKGREPPGTAPPAPTGDAQPCAPPFPHCPRPSQHGKNSGHAPKNQWR
jgi:hypothetical protein